MDEAQILNDYQRGLLTLNEAQKLLFRCHQNRRPVHVPSETLATCPSCGAACVWRATPTGSELIDLATQQRHARVC